MKLSEKVIKQLEQDLDSARDVNELMGKDGAIKNLVKNLIEEMLGAELTAHLGYEKHERGTKKSSNRRNGSSSKTLTSDMGHMPVDIPRDRNGEFDPVLIKKYSKKMGLIEDKILSMYGHGMTVRDIQTHIHDMYGLELSPTAVSHITDKVLETVTQWQSRPLDSVYPIVYLDAIHFKVREEGKIVSKAGYTVLGINSEGLKDLLGIWIGENEGATFWLNILTELRNRGIEDILICSVDGLKGFPDAIRSIFPKTEVQLCVIHQIRNSLHYISYKHQKEFMKDLKLVYKASTEEAGRFELDNLEEKWGKKYPLVIKSWKNNWPELSVYFKYPEEIRRIIYTTNSVEALHRQFRKITKTKTIFPHDDSLRKILFMAYRNLKKKWNRPIQNWPFIISQLAIVFEGRIQLNL